MTTMTDRETLIATRALIEDPARWTTGELARDAEGNNVNPNEPEAVCWCIEGALLKTSEVRSKDVSDLRAWHFAQAASAEIFATHAPYMVNDSCGVEGGHAAVLRMLDRAIELATD